MKSKNIVKYIFFCLGFVLIIILRATYRDIKVNKFFNYISVPKNIQYTESFSRGEEATITYDLIFTATDDFLGAVIVPLRYLNKGEGKVIFKIKEEDGDQWIHTNTYDYNYFRILNKYVLGFPVINNSKNVKYTVNLTFIGDRDHEFMDILDRNVENSLKVKFVFPRSVAFGNPSIVVNILKHRIIASALEIDYASLILIIFLLIIVIFYISNNTVLEISPFGKDDLLLIAQKIMRPKYGSYFMGIAFLLTILIPPLIIFGHFSLAEEAANYIWISLLLGLVWYVTSSLLPKAIQWLFDVGEELYMGCKSIFSFFHFKKSFPFVLLLFILIAGLNKTYLLGGDDSRLFFLYPREFFVNFSSKIVSDVAISNVGLVIPPGSTAAFTLVMIILKNILGSLNLQSIFYTANLVGGFISFQLLVNWLVPTEGKYSRLIKLTTSYLYVFSIFNIYTIYNSKLLAIFLVSIFPLTLYLSLRAIVERKPYLIITSALLLSVFCLPTLGAPWYYSTLISIIPLLIFVLKNHKLNAFKYFLILIFSFVVLNLHWLAYLPNLGSAGGGIEIYEGGLTSYDYRKKTTEGIRTVSEISSVFYPMMNIYPEDIQRNFNWPYYSIFKDWYRNILPFNLVFIVTILLAGFFINRNKKKVRIFISISLSFLLAVYFLSVNITKWGIDIFVWLNNYIPGFVMFRNMYDKFAFSVAFTFSILLYISISVLISKIKSERVKKYLLFSLASVAILNSKPFLSREFAREPLWTTSDTYSDTTAFNEEFMNMMKYIKDNPEQGKYLSLPLTSGNAFPVQDLYKPNHYYNGVSPVLVFGGKNDFSGLLSFGPYGEEVLNSIREKDYESFGNILKRFNIKYAIVNYTITPDLQNSFVYSDGLYFLQDDEFMESVLGDKVRDFGEKYSLYEVNDKYQSEKIFLSSSESDIFNDEMPVRYRKISNHEWDVAIDSVNDSNYLIFLDPYFEGWELLSSNYEALNLKHSSIFGYANGWYLDPDKIKNSTSQLNGDKSSIQLKLYYRPYGYYSYLVIFSVLAYIVLTTYVIRSFLKYKLKSK